MWYSQKNRQIDQWNQTESTEIDPHKHSQLNVDKSTKANQWRNSNFFQQMSLEQLGIHMQNTYTHKIKQQQKQFKPLALYINQNLIMDISVIHINTKKLSRIKSSWL